MVDRIERLYRHNTDRPDDRDKAKRLPAKAGESEELSREDGRIRRENIAERIAPHLQDKVELSDKARAAVRVDEAQDVGEASAMRAEARDVAEGWYGAGVRQAYEMLDRLEGENR